MTIGILCVDDEPHVLSSLELTLGREYRVSTATSGDEGMSRLAGGETYHVIISDMRMPGMNGAEFLKKSRVLCPDAIRILLTGHADVDAAIAAINEGRIFRFLSKPCPPDELKSAVASAIEQYRLLTADRELVREEARKLSEKRLHTERLATLGTMASAVGHELNNVTAVLSSLVYSIKRAAANGVTANQEELEDLEWVLTHLKMHGRELLDLGRPSSAQEELFDLRAIVRDTVERLQVMGQLKLVDVELSLSPKPTDVLGCQKQLEQVLINLLVNAADAIDAAKRSDPLMEVSVQSTLDGTMIRCQVSDNGVGISPDDASRIFEPYYTTKGPEQGTGLGLTVCRQLIESHEGTLKAKPRPGGGTTMTIELPAAGSRRTREIPLPDQELLHG